MKPKTSAFLNALLRDSSLAKTSTNSERGSVSRSGAADEAGPERNRQRHKFGGAASRGAALRFVCGLVALLLLNGCVGVLPFPEFSNQPTKGTKLGTPDTAFIQVGSTPAAEVFAKLGTNCLCTPRWRAVAFSWELPGGRGVWWAASMEAGASGEFEWSRWRAFFLAFDTNDVVIAAGTKHLSAGKSLHEHLEVWAQKYRVAPDHLHPESFVAKHP